MRVLCSHSNGRLKQQTRKKLISSKGGDGSDPYVKNPHSQEKKSRSASLPSLLSLLLMAILLYESHLITKIHIYFWSVPQSLSLCP